MWVYIGFTSTDWDIYRVKYEGSQNRSCSITFSGYYDTTLWALLSIKIKLLHINSIPKLNLVVKTLKYSIFMIHAQKMHRWEMLEALKINEIFIFPL